MSKKISNKQIAFMIILVTIIVIIDQITKFAISGVIYNSQIIVINNVLNFTYVENKGGAFGIGQNSLISFIATNVIVLGIIIKFIVFQIDKIDNKTMFSLLLIFGGGVSNLADRIIKGCVIDFIDINSIIKFPIFNLADACVVIGFILLLIFITTYTFGDNRKKIEQDVKI